MQLLPVLWRGELVALAGRERFHLVAPWLSRSDARDADLEYVALLCLYYREVIEGRLPHVPDPGRAERWADIALRRRREMNLSE